MDAPPSDNLFVTGLPMTITDDQVRQVFGIYGNVTQCKVLDGRNSKASALVRFQTVEQAAWMVENVNGNVPNGLVDPVTVRFADTPETKAQRQLQGHSRNGYAPQEYKRPPSDRILVSGLPAHLDLDFVKRIFDAYGTVRTCKLLGDGTAALVHFSSEEDASRVVQGLSGVIPNGLSSPVSVQFADSPAHPPPQAQSMGMMNIIVNGFMQAGVLPGRRLGNSEYAVYIAGLPSDTEDHHLYRLFACFGPIAPKGVRAMLNPDGTCTGIGFVNFLTPEAVQAAVTTFNGAILPDGTVLKVAMKTPKGHQS